MFGFYNKILKIDLNTETFKYDDISDEVLKKTLGGKGLGAYLLTELNPVGVDPLSSENIFIITPGPVSDTTIWGQSRYAVFSKSPATGGYGEAYCGGKMAPKIKRCGADAIVLMGASSKLQFLEIDESGVKFHDAAAIKGADTVAAENYILERSPKGAGVMVIGPAGENKVAIACIKSDRWRSLGRGGLGAVLGSKNIKGISFFGSKKCAVADSEKIKELTKKIAKIGKESPVTPKYQKLGTPMQVEVLNMQKCFPTRYWSKGYHEDWKKISAIYMQENFEVKATACPSCFLKCTKMSTIKKGEYKGLTLEGPEFETIYALGGLNELDSLEEVAYLNDLCDKLGIDTMSAGNLTAFAIEAFKKGKTSFEIDYNEPKKMATLLADISNRKGLGDILAKGIKQASKELDLEDIAIHVKGLEPGGFEPRVLKGMGLSFATSPRGACHLRGTFYKAELSGQMDKDQIVGKAKLHIDYEDRAALFDSLIICRFFRDFILWDEISEIVEATTGLKYSKSELEELANEITQMTRRYNTREGLGPETDTLPKRFLTEATKEGATLSIEDLNIMLKEYNEIRER